MQPLLTQALRAGIAAVEPQAVVGKHLKRQGLDIVIGDRRYGTPDLRLIAVGKAAVPMARAVQNLVGDRLQQAVVISPALCGDFTAAGWQQIQGAHPLPDIGSLAAGEAVVELLANGTPETVILVCVSGGATALLIHPPPEIPLETLRAVYQALLASGSDIQAMNGVRSRLDLLKGGRLVALSHPAQVVGLILSDVVGDSIGTIGSGLTAHPAAHNYLVGNNQQACQGVAAILKEYGYLVQIVTSTLEGEAQEVGREIARAIRLAPPGTALIYGGETTVTLGAEVRGIGGRNQELVLSAAIELAGGSEALWVAAMGTDGVDGQSVAAGAIANHLTLTRAKALGLDAQTYLQRHDSYHFFEPLGDLIVTGPTATNVADLAIAIHQKK